MKRLKKDADKRSPTSSQTNKETYVNRLAITYSGNCRLQLPQDRTVEMDGLRFSPHDLMLDELAIQVAGLKEIAEAQQSPFSVTVTPHPDAYHERVVDVMDACAAARVTNLIFGKSTV